MYELVSALTNPLLDGRAQPLTIVAIVAYFAAAALLVAGKWWRSKLRLPAVGLVCHTWLLAAAGQAWYVSGLDRYNTVATAAQRLAWLLIALSLVNIIVTIRSISKVTRAASIAA